MRSNQLSYLAVSTQTGAVGPRCIGAPKGNRTLDLLLTMETLCRLSYRGDERNSRRTGIATATPAPVSSLTAGRSPGGTVLTTRPEGPMTIVAGEGFEPP